MIPLPLKPKIVSEQGNRAVFEIEGLYPGYGQTIGNSLRRVLLSSLEGAVITSVKIKGAGHEFSALEGVLEDMVELTLNLKQVRFRLHGEGPVTISLSKKGEGTAKAGDFETPSQVDVINKDALIATLTSKKAVFEIEAVVESGLGYVPVEGRSKEKVEVGTIALDAPFSPVRHVNYEVENMRVQDRTDYNRLRIHLETDGSLSPREAFVKAVEILIAQCGALREGFIEEKYESAPVKKEETAIPEKEEAEEGISNIAETVLKTKLDELKISSRTLNALREAGIKTVGGVSRKREETLRELPGIGEKGIQEIKKAMGNFGIILK